MYEKKLVQLLVSPPCELPDTERPGKQHGFEDSDDSEDPAVNIILKGNIKFSKDKGKESKKKPVNEIKRQQADMGKPNSDCEKWKVLIKRSETPTSKRRPLDIYCLSQKLNKGVRYAARPSPRTKHGCVTKENYCQQSKTPGSSFPRQNPRNSFPCQIPKSSFPCLKPRSSFPFQNPGSSFPWSVKLAILGIFIIVLFVYITVEKKPLLG